MRAAVMQDWKLSVEELPDPRPATGQALTRVLACGICGSDLHMLVHGKRQRELQAELSAGVPDDPMRPIPFDPDAKTVMGHEFCCEVVELGPECSNLQVGDRVVSMPVTFDPRGVHALGYSSLYNGGYADLMVVSDLLALKIPNGLDHRVAAMTEPFAVGVHAVNKSGIVPGEAAIVLGCGPVGLACIAAMRTKGIEPIIAADFSPRRRALAAQLGAHVVVDPREEPAVEAWRRADSGWPTRTIVVFEAVGVPGLIDQAMRIAPRGSRVVVVGVCMEHDAIWPIVGIGKELNIQFVLAYDPLEFADALRMLAEGVVDLSPMVTAEIPVDGVPQAFHDLANPEAHAKILVTPGT